MHRRWRLLFLLSVTDAGLSLADDGATPAREAVELRAREGLPNFFRKACGTNLVRVAYFGGSITAADGWRPQSLAWLRARYPAAQFEQVNAAIGGTGSDLGVFRLQRDVLVHKPDLVFVEFAVNDGGAPPAQIHRCLEGIVRQVWKADPATDLCFVYTLHEGMTNDLAAGRLPRSAAAMEQVADHYGIPSIHLALEAARRIRVGEWVFIAPTPEAPTDPAKGLAARPAFAPDGCHPFAETGHRLYTEAIARSFEKMENLGQPAPHALGQPFTPDHHQNAKMIALDRRFLAGDWEKLEPADNSLARSFANRLPALWQADRAGASLRFSFRGRWACIYDLLGPDGGELEVIVDGRAPTKAQRFDAYCTYHRLGMLPLFSDTNSADHSLTVRLTDTSFDKAAILRRNGNTMDRPERYAPLRWQAGAILIDGELIEPLPAPETAATPAHRRLLTKSEPDAVIYEGAYPGWPWVARGRDGTLHCVFREGTEHDFSAAGKALLCQSRDGGRTWSKPTVVVDHPGVDDRNVAITVLTNDQLLVVFNTYNGARASLATRTHSSDGGRTWSPPTAIDQPNTRTRSAAVTLNDGTLLLPYYVAPGNGSLAARSSDLGQTWTTTRVPDTEGFLGDEWDLLEIAPGRVLGVIRNSDPKTDGVFWVTESRDGGRTWSTPKRTNVQSRRAPSPPQLCFHNQTPTLVFADRRMVSVSAVKTLDPQFLDWEIERCVPCYAYNADESPILDGSYPASVQTGPHERLIVDYEIRPGARRIAAYRVEFPESW